MYFFNSDTAYQARIQLAVLDHNAHVNRNAKQHKQTHEYQYYRRYRKQTKHWDVVKVLEAKEYKYIPELMKAIQHNWEQSVFTMKSKQLVDAQHPVNIQQTIAHIQPPNTCITVNEKKIKVYIVLNCS